MAFLLLLETFNVSFFSFIIFMILISFNLVLFYPKTKKSLPPSPPKLPIIGNFHQLGSSPYRSLQTLSHKYGPLMLIHLGSIPILVASSVEVAREIMKNHDLSFSNRPNLTIPNILCYGSSDVAFSAYGEHWRQLKSIVVLNLLSNTRVKSFQKVREEEMGHIISKIEESCGTLVDLSALFESLTNNIICRVALGRTYDGVDFTDMLTNIVNILGVFSVGDYIPWLSWVDRISSLERKAQKIAKELDDFLISVIEEHLNKKTGENAQQDFVDILLDVQRENTTGFVLHADALKAVIFDIFAAGTDTTSTSLDWTMCELMRHPKVMKKLQHEVTEIAQGRSMILEEDLEKMKYLKAVIKEALRLHAPAPLLVPRKSTQEVKLMGYDIPKGTQLMINAWAVGRDPVFWEEPEVFRPERFLNNSTDYKGLQLDANWLPFGAGRRGCPGIRFAVVVIELALANAIYKFNFDLPNGVEHTNMDMSEANGITVRRKESLLVIASKRF